MTMVREPETYYGQQYFTFHEAAEYLRCGLRFIQEKVQAQEIPVVLMGHKTKRIRRRDLDRWAEEHLSPKPKAGTRRSRE
jgi:excisionase family DNA binding protein